MQLRIKKTLAVFAVLVGINLLWSIPNMTKSGWHWAITPGFTAYTLFSVAYAGFVWWAYGPSERAVAMRAKAEAKKAERRAQRLG
ncbi:hypothetical protein GXW83_32370 [Streptacidiphilus sp. PB12-B1b]|uniref:hypothetical protein n=1 Tax=Streptacidiphilus sp. PB12-B1b TaxID=2705012 RepID=UPI0015FCA6A2|nr:hypothetical protein [Streptacidiphilus sp. PB12-B1b]QMU79704.1 hypothetical protein GXW83_32370 [Streptacidiphilus sp. PB12-B1b]